MLKRIRQVSEFVHDFLAETGNNSKNMPWGPEYRWEHTLRVAHWAWLLAREEGVDAEKSVVAALFYDVSHFASETIADMVRKAQR